MRWHDGRRGPVASRRLGCLVPDAASPPTRTTLRLGVAGPVGTGKSSIIALVCRELAGELQLGVITNDIYTDE
ncbi:MAG TPA: GTP-binding protein, partial [Nakamurella sp.]